MRIIVLFILGLVAIDLFIFSSVVSAAPYGSCQYGTGVYNICATPKAKKKTAKTSTSTDETAITDTSPPTPEEPSPTPSFLTTLQPAQTTDEEADSKMRNLILSLVAIACSIALVGWVLYRRLGKK